MATVGNVMTRAQSEASMRRIVGEFDERGFGLWAVEVPGAAEFIGFVGLSVPRADLPFLPAVEVGWRLAFEHWGKGFATEAARASITYGFGELGLEEIVSFTAASNDRSRRVMERLGMHRDLSGDFEHPTVPEGDPMRRHVLYRVTAAEWPDQATYN